MGPSRSRSGIRGPSCLDKLLAHAVMRMESAAAAASALADDPMQDMEEHLGLRSKRRRRRRCPSHPLACIEAPEHLVARADSEDVPDDMSFHVYVVPQATTRLDVYVLEAHVPARIAFVRHELTERRREVAGP